MEVAVSSNYYALGYESREEQEEYVAGAVSWLESFCQRKLPQDEAGMWMERLSKYPRAKISRLSEYTGRMTNDVFKFLEDMSLNRGYTALNPQLEEPIKAVDEKLHKLVFEHASFMFSTASKEDKERRELEFMQSMRKKFPRVKWECGMQANRGK